GGDQFESLLKILLSHSNFPRAKAATGMRRTPDIAGTTVDTGGKDGKLISAANTAVVDLLRRKYVQARGASDQAKMDEIAVACPDAFAATPMEPTAMPTGQRIRGVVADLNRAHQYHDKLTKHLQRATEHRDDMIHRIGDTMVELAGAGRIFLEAK
ncbi:unnamed protein product, partial [Prorocentrum cordatum]